MPLPLQPPHHISYSAVAMGDLENSHYRPKSRDFSNENESNLKHRILFLNKSIHLPGLELAEDFLFLRTPTETFVASCLHLQL